MSTRRDAIRTRLSDLGVDGLLVTKLVNVRYLTGYSGTNGQVLIDGDDVFFTDPRYEEQSARECADIERIVYSTQPAAVAAGGGMMGSIAAAVKRAGIARLGVEAAHMSLATASRLRGTLDGVELIETDGVVEDVRLVKSADEVEQLRAACAIGDQGLERLLPTLAEGQSEVEVAAALEDAMRRLGSEGLSFDTIVAFGEQAAEPHHRPTDRRLKSGDLIKIDFGATSRGYHSDMTRTVAFGRPSDAMREVYDLVKGAQQAGLDAVRPGITTGDVDAAARGYLTERGHDFGHGTGHGVGLEVHEAPSVRAGAADVLREGMVITVEPGIYLPGVGGVRIEDTVVVTADGCDILTRSTKDLIEV